MPTVNLNVKDICKLIGREISIDKLAYVLPLIKCEVKSTETEEVSVEVNADRPDMLSTEGITRTLKGFIGLETGCPSFHSKRGKIKVEVDKHLKNIRPFIACAVIRNINLTEESLRQLLQIQEKLHETLCRKRRKASIGIYDLDKVKPPFTYTAAQPEEVKFTPLESMESMTATKILENTDKGREYGGIIKEFNRYPLLLDSGGTVLSMPPIINSENTKVTVDSQNLFLDVTSLSEYLANDAVSILAANFAERGAKIEAVQVLYPSRRVYTALMKPKKMYLETEYANKVSGLRLSAKAICALAGKMRYDARVAKKDRIEINIPPYRCDILHPIDLIEDIIIGYGYDRIKPEVPLIPTFGKKLEKTNFIERMRDIMIGYGFQEILNYVLTSKELQTSMMKVEDSDLIEIANPMTSEYTVLRKWLLPGILNFLTFNTHVENPQKIFECGETVILDSEAHTKTRSEIRLAGAVSDYSVSYETIQSIVYGVLQNLKINAYKTFKRDHESFMKGRTASIIMHQHEIAILGEINPEILTKFKLPNPVVAFEINLTPIFRRQNSPSD
ncbi:MAG: phenylalanine--tRNA ligase subunit beta [Candidatus Bathyarchaeota archaeon]